MKCPVCGASGVATRVKDGRRCCAKCKSRWWTTPRGQTLPVYELPPACVEDLLWLWKNVPAPKEAV